MLSIILIIFSAIFFAGLINRTKSIISGRRGPGIFQPLKDIYVFFKKGSVFSKTTSIIFQISPAIYLASIITAMLLIPFAGYNSIISVKADFVIFAYLLALGKFFMIISALDTGSGFEGMGANREALYSMLIEPAFFILMGSLALLTGYTSFHDIFTHITFNNPYAYIIGIIVVYVLAQIAMIENSRLPVDDPKTHLELTMVHEVMILDNSGFDMALINIASSLKFAIYGTLIFNSVIPSNLNVFGSIGIYMVCQALFAITIGALESFRARNKMMKNSQFIITVSSIALLAFALVIILTNKFI
jgi:formate hydrogenlyase subunit 4